MKVDLVNMDEDEFDDSDLNQIMHKKKDNNDEHTATIEDNLLASTSQVSGIVGDLNLLLSQDGEESALLIGNEDSMISLQSPSLLHLKSP